MRDKELIANVPSISCVENYFLGWCKEAGIGEAPLYGESYLTAAEIFSDFLYADARFESYGKIPRVMETAERCGAAFHTACREFDFEAIDEAIAAGGLVLAEVNERFFKDIALKPWREDHYIWLTGKTDNGYTYLNNYPLSAGSMGRDKPAAVYGGKTLVFKQGIKIDEIFVKANIKRQIKNIACAANGRFLSGGEIRQQALRDALGILKITRRRLKAWFAAIDGTCGFTYTYAAQGFTEKYCAFLNAAYVSVEAAILRKRFDADKALEAVNGIMEKERELSRHIKEGIARE